MHRVSIRLSVVLVALMGLTLVSWLAGHDIGSRQIAAIVVLGAAFLKIAAVFWEFMDVRGGPTWLKAATLGWTGLAFSILVALYIYGEAVAPFALRMGL